MINLRFKNTHKSIKNLPNITLPKLTILTGINGAGKTHLLEAIQNDCIIVDGIKQHQICYYNWNDFSPKIDDTGSPHKNYRKRQDVIDRVIQILESSKKSITNFAKQHGISGDEKLMDFDYLITVSETDLSHILRSCSQRGTAINSNIPILVKDFQRYRESAQHKFVQKIQQYGSLLAHLEGITKSKGCTILQLSPEVSWENGAKKEWKDS